MLFFYFFILSGSTEALVRLTAVDAFKYAFLPRTIPAWNALPQLVAEADSLDTFKQHRLD